MTETPKEAARRLSAPILAKGFKPVALHTYTDAEGRPTYWRIRAKHPDTSEKWIRPMKLNGQGYELGEPKFDTGKPLYALHRIASNPDAVVWIVEGEQKADALNKLGLVATTSGGASSAEAADWEPLRGRTGRIWPDNDEPGKGYAGAVASILLGMGCTVSCIDVDKLGLGIGEDVMQWLAAHPGATGADIDALPILTLYPSQENAPACDAGGAELVCVDARHLLSLKLPPRNPLLSPWLNEQSLAMLYAWRGTGKTWLSLSIAYAVASGSNLLGWQTQQARRVLYIDGEMPARALQQRLGCIVGMFDKEPPDGYLQFITPDLQADGIMPDLTTLEGQARIDTWAENAALIVIDNLSCLAREGKENEAESWRPVSTWALRHRARGRAVLFNHHSGKGGAQRGTSKREDLLDVVIKLQTPKEHDAQTGAAFELHFEKSREMHGQSIEPILCALLDKDGALSWEYKAAENSILDNIEALITDGADRKEIEGETGLSRFQLKRLVDRANTQGRSIRLPDARKRGRT